MNKLNYSLLIIVLICWSCAKKSESEKHQNKRNIVVNVREKVKEIIINEDDVLVGATPHVYLLDNYLIISDHRSVDKLIHIFDINGYTYLKSTAERGQGPDEITNMGQINTNETKREFYVSDNGKLIIFQYNLDSVLTNPVYKPKVKMRMDKILFPVVYQYINDTLSIGQIIEPVGNFDFNEHVAKFNMNTGEITTMKYKHPGLKKNLAATAASVDYGIYVECSQKYDLMIICSLNGDLRHIIYGPNWNRNSDGLFHYQEVRFCNNRILATYSGEDWNTAGRPTKFFVFDLTGNYIRTIETGYKIIDFCHDTKNNRLIMSLNDAKIQFAYLDLDGLID